MIQCNCPNTFLIPRGTAGETQILGVQGEVEFFTDGEGTTQIGGFVFGRIRSIENDGNGNLRPLNWVPGLVNIQKAIESDHRNSGFTHSK